MPDPVAFNNLGVTDAAGVVTDIMRLDNSPGAVLLPGRGFATQGWVVKTLDTNGVLTWNGERSIQVRGFTGPVDRLETILHNFDPVDGQLLTLTADPSGTFFQVDVRDLGAITSGSKQILTRGVNAHCLLDNTLREQLHLRWDSAADQWREQSRSQSVKRRVWIPESALRNVGTPVVSATIGTTPTVTVLRLNSTDDGAIATFVRPPDYADATAVLIGLSISLQIAEAENDIIRMLCDYITILNASTIRNVNHAHTQIAGIRDVGVTFGLNTLFELTFAPVVTDSSNPFTTWDSLVAEMRLDATSDVAQVNVLGAFLEYSPVV